jgi:hypothetical protein
MLRAYKLYVFVSLAAHHELTRAHLRNGVDPEFLLTDHIRNGASTKVGFEA